MRDISPSRDRLVLSGEFEGYEPDELFAMWVVPDFLERWWPMEAEVQSGVGGRYKFSWPNRGWVLEGEYSAWQPGQHLGFTWRWTHDPADTSQFQVEVSFNRLEQGGTCLTIVQWPYSETDADQTARDSHREGWLHFCMRLAGLRYGDLKQPEERCDTEAAPYLL